MCEFVIGVTRRVRNARISTSLPLFLETKRNLEFPRTKRPRTPDIDSVIVAPEKAPKTSTAKREVSPKRSNGNCCKRFNTGYSLHINRPTSCKLFSKGSLLPSQTEYKDVSHPESEATPARRPSPTEEHALRTRQTRSSGILDLCNKLLRSNPTLPCTTLPYPALPATNMYAYAHSGMHAWSNEPTTRGYCRQDVAAKGGNKAVFFYA